MHFLRSGIHGFHETVGIDVDELRFWWALASDIVDDRQTAYQILVSTDQKALQSGHSGDAPGRVWDSGKVSGDVQRNVICKPESGFAATTCHFWTVTVWDAEGKTHTSDVNTFFTAYPRSHLLPPWSMNQTYMPHTSLIFRAWLENEHDRWKGVWIGDGGDKPIYLRKAFRIDKKPQRAYVLASGLGHFNLSVNGQAASNHVLDPGWTNYHRTVQFVGYDVSTQIRQGSNAIGAHIGNGFYAGDQGDRFFWPMYEDNTYVRYGNELCFFAELHLFFEDGSHEVMHTDPSWKVRRSATTLANIYASEDHDRRQYPTGWDADYFDDASWSPAKPLTGPRGQLRYQSQPPVTLHEVFEPVKTTSPKTGTVCYDLGQNASIMVKIKVQGKAGDEVIIRYAETARDDGTVLMPDKLFKQFETHVYSKIILSGDGVEEWTPDFCFTAARYLQVEGVSLEEGTDLPVIKSIVGQHVSSAARRLGSVKTDVDDVNQLINACYWSFASNLFSYHTDCPQIEKFGWLEVTHLLAPSTQYIRDMESLYSKILDDILDTQESTGLVPTMAPEIRYMCGPLHDTITWGCALCFLPDILKKYYGSTHVIPKVFPAARRYMEYISKKERQGGLIEHGLGDWGRDIAFGNHQANLETAVYYHCLRCVEMMARELGEKEEEAKWKKEAERIYAVYNKHLLITDDEEVGHAYYTSLDAYPKRDRTAVAQGVALQFGLVPKDKIADVEKAFLADVADCRIRAGEIGLKYLWETLGDLKRPDVVLAMARQEEHPSYMRFLRRGETTLLEFWQDECRSKSHDMLGTIYEWFYANVLGIKPVGEAYKTFIVNPAWESEFGKVQGNVDTPYGDVAVTWEKKSGGYALDVTVPFGTTATIKLPEGTSKASFEREKGGKQQVDGKSIELRHGAYSFDISA
ncbi:bacterial alpha-L-rhamnosidase-domain-containing protein [Elsinoe ampelina]|uniref:alpha-L-rhamnosidase n=1 Tax=Elsinoe ampelina TaxID=302913 RepID=A0A6A6GJS6_9PEZI|nr:bacterial alpha-L-rhamnosidase-domain-containing protein [Elsinoe ampelina]